MSSTQIALKFLNYDSKSNIIFYTISVTDIHTKETWIFQSRYSEMFSLHQQLSLNSRSNLPRFPPKRCCYNTEPAFVSQRQKALENYFNTLLKNHSLNSLPDLKNFFYGMKSQSSNVSSASKRPKNEYNSIYLGPKKSLGLKNAVDTISVRFIDLTLNLNPPEEEDIIRKKGFVNSFKWPPLKSDFFHHYHLPKGNERNLIDIGKITLGRSDEEIISSMEKAISKITQKSYAISNIFEPPILVHEMS